MHVRHVLQLLSTTAPWDVADTRSKNSEGCLSESGTSAHESERPNVSASAVAAEDRQPRAAQPTLARDEVHMFSQSVTHLEDSAGSLQFLVGV